MMALKREEAKIIRDIKASAKQGNQAAMKILAKSLVRLRGQITKLQGSSAQLQGVGMTMTVSVVSCPHAGACRPRPQPAPMMPTLCVSWSPAIAQVTHLSSPSSPGRQL
jgi:hypothetical protein